MKSMSEFLSQADLANRLVEKTGVSLETAKKFSAVFFRIVKTGLKNSDSITVHNFGTFKKTWIETTTALNPQTGEKIEVPAHWRIKFVPCAAVARRINKPYARLKPKLYKEPKNKEKAASEQEEDENSGLLAAAEAYRAAMAEKEAQEEPVPDVITAEEIAQEIVDENDDMNDTEETDGQNKKPLKFFAIIGVGALLLILLIALLVRSCSSNKDHKKSNTPAQSVETVIQENLAQDEPSEKVTAPKKAEKPAPAIKSAPKTEEIIAPATAHSESYSVPTGSNYHTIAELKYKNRHLWPVLYAANRAKNPDPDFVAGHSTIEIPAIPAGEAGISMITSAMMDAYDGYIEMCRKQSSSPRNGLRTNRAIRVLVSAELLQKGFIDSHESHFQKEHVAKAREILKTQYN